MAPADDVFKRALAGKKLPPLTLDNKWHKLFNQAAAPNSCIKKGEKELNGLLKRQGKLTTELKQLKKVKTDLMNEIVDGMDAEDGKSKGEKSRLINEINDKMEAEKDELKELPVQMDEVNNGLMLETMNICYDKLRNNTDEIEEISNWVRDVRIELKKKLIRKQEKEIENIELYTYMNDIFGPEVADLFDLRYDVEERRRELLEKREAVREKQMAREQKMEKFEEALEERKEADEQKRAEEELKEAQESSIQMRRRETDKRAPGGREKKKENH